MGERNGPNLACLLYRIRQVRPVSLVARLLVNITTSHSAQMITTGIAVGSDGKVNLGPAPTFGILLAILFSHSLVCPSNSRILARISLVTGFINGMSGYSIHDVIVINILFLM